MALLRVSVLELWRWPVDVVCRVFVLRHALLCSTGTISSYNCAAGTGGLFCATCPVGTYKAETGNGPCLACSDKPEMAEYVQSGVTSAACPYVCKQGYNTADCLSQFQAVIRALGGLFGFFACVLALLLLTAGASLAVYWRRKRADRCADGRGARAGGMPPQSLCLVLTSAVVL